MNYVCLWCFQYGTSIWSTLILFFFYQIDRRKGMSEKSIEIVIRKVMIPSLSHCPLSHINTQTFIARSTSLQHAIAVYSGLLFCKQKRWSAAFSLTQSENTTNWHRGRELQGRGVQTGRGGRDNKVYWFRRKFRKWGGWKRRQHIASDWARDRRENKCVKA